MNANDPVTELRSRLRGHSVAPSDDGYDDARRVFARRYDVSPALVAFPADVDDVVVAVNHAREHDLWLVPRGGGHSFAGFSVGDGAVVLDLSEMRDVRLDPEPRVAKVGAGSRILDVYEALAAHGATIAAGECVHVGIAGLTLGGGLGYLSRKHGLTCDELLEVELVTADGRVITASEREHPDLYWACRGGGGGNFAIATSFRFRARDADPVTSFQLRWPWAAAGSVVAAWQAWAPSGPDELFAALRLDNTPRAPGATPQVAVAGCYLGAPQQFARLRDELEEAVGGPPASAAVQHQEWFEAIKGALEDPTQRLYAACEGDVDFGLATRSAYVREPLPRLAIEKIVEWLERRQDDPALNDPAPDFRPGVALLEPYGGAIGRIASDATAFVHREELFLILLEARWHYHHADPRAHDAWLGAWYEEMLPFTSGFAYQNYPDRALDDWQRAYYGANLPRLRDVKSAYDPDGLLRFEQSIPPA